MKPNIPFLNKRERQALFEELKEIYGYEKKDDTIFIKGGKQRTRAYTGNLTREQLEKLNEVTKVELIGQYFVSQKDKDPRLSFDALSRIRDEIKVDTIALNKDQYELWMRGYDLDIKAKNGVIVVSYQGDLIGIGKSNGETIFNYVPKERKLKTPLPSKENK